MLQVLILIVFFGEAALDTPQFTAIPDKDEDSVSQLTNANSTTPEIIPKFDTGDTLIYCRDKDHDEVILNEPGDINLPSTFHDYNIIAQESSKTDLEHTLHLKDLSQLQEEYIKAHTKLNHSGR